MPFSRPRPNTIASDEDFTVTDVRRDSMLYTEREKRLVINIELGTDAIAIYDGRRWAWEPPYDGLLITEPDRARIVSNLRRAFAWAGQRRLDLLS